MGRCDGQARRLHSGKKLNICIERAHTLDCRVRPGTADCTFAPQCDDNSMLMFVHQSRSDNGRADAPDQPSSIDCVPCVK
jgi:hypothetical protein